MRLKPAHIAATGILCFLMISTGKARAQEGAQHDMDAATLKESVKTDPDPAFSSESEARSTKVIVPVAAMPPSSKEVVRDSAQVKIIKPVKSAQKTTQKEEDPLSFNFLYYIIEKFKLSDVIQ